MLYTKKDFLCIIAFTFAEFLGKGKAYPQLRKHLIKPVKNGVKVANLQTSFKIQLPQSSRTFLQIG